LHKTVSSLHSAKTDHFHELQSDLVLNLVSTFTKKEPIKSFLLFKKLYSRIKRKKSAFLMNFQDENSSSSDSDEAKLQKGGKIALGFLKSY